MPLGSSEPYLRSRCACKDLPRAARRRSARWRKGRPWVWLAAALLASPLAADSFYAVTPCRVLDTRTTNSPVLANTPTLFAVGGLCGIPAVASSVSFNVTLVGRGITVDLGMAAGDAVAPPSTNVVSTNQQDSVIAGAAVIPLSVDGQGTVVVLANSTSSGSTDLILDVNGYFLSSSPGGLAQLYAQGGDGDPGTATDPLLDPQPSNTLGQTPGGFGDAGPSSTSPCPPLVCPLRYDLATKRYFSYNSSPVRLVGVSADNACHLHGGNGYDMCTFSPTAKANYQNVLTDAAAKGLNKIQLWVNLNGGNWQASNTCKPQKGCVCVAEPPDPRDQPFKYYPPGSPGFPANVPDNIGYWNLDERNDTFFADLQTVVQYAASTRPSPLFVEVTFFAPWIGVWQLSPWNPNHGRLSTDPTHTIPVGFTHRSYFVQPGSSSDEALRAYQKKVIDWTIAALDAPPSSVNGGLPFDKVYFEIANEPENGNPPTSSTSCGEELVSIPALASGVTTWQQEMITEVVNDEKQYVTPNGVLYQPHLIAVQPLTQAGTTPYLPAGGSGVTVINGHYTTVAVGAFPLGESPLGAITMARMYAGQAGPLIVASNEGKISGDTTVFPWGGQSIACGWEAPTRLSCPKDTQCPPYPTGPAGVDCFGEADAARAEAWEFMLDLGSGFDHYGYYWNSDFGQQIRGQLGALQKFLAPLPLRQMKTSADPLPPNKTTGPTWISIGPSPYSNPTQNPTKYFAALEPTLTAASHTYLLYIHNSTRHPGQAGVGFSAFGGYKPIYNASFSNPQYRETTFTLCLAPVQAQHYLEQWIDPKTGKALGPSSMIAGTSPCGTPALASPYYSYDIALLITQVP